MNNDWIKNVEETPFNDEVTEAEAIEDQCSDASAGAADGNDAGDDAQSGEAEEVEAEIIDPVPMLAKTKSGTPAQTSDNFAIVLENDTQLKDHFYYDTQGYITMVVSPLPWGMPFEDDRPIRDDDYSGFVQYTEPLYGLTSKNKAIDAITNVSMTHAKNPLAEWLDSLKWDGKPRIETLLHDFLGAEKNEYTAGIMRLWMLGAVARAYEPGIKFDYMLVLIGKQGIGKSEFIKKLVPNDLWYLANFPKYKNDPTISKHAVELIRGIWIAEMPDHLSRMKEDEIDDLKGFLTIATDTARVSYGHISEHRPRVTVFAATVNNPQYGIDDTGNRRFLSVMCGIYPPKLSLYDTTVKDYLAQAWAETVHILKTEKPPLYLDGILKDLADEMNERCSVDNPDVGRIQQYLDRYAKGIIRIPNYDKESLNMCTLQIRDDVFIHGSEVLDRDIPSFQKINKIMLNRIDGWQPTPNPSGKAQCNKYGAQKCYVPIPGYYEKMIADEANS